MKKKNNYKEIREILKYLESSESSINDSERDLVLALDDIMQIDRSNTVIKELFNKDYKFQQLLSMINEEIKNADFLIKSKFNNYKKYVTRKEKMIELKNNILNFFNSQNIEIEDIKDDLIEKCLPSLNLGHYKQQVFFGNTLVEENGKSYELNKTTINKVYDVLKDSDLMSEIVIGVEKNEQVEKFNSIVKSCSEANRYRNKVYSNKELIFKYNSLSRKAYELNKYLRSVRLNNLSAKLEGINNEINDLLKNKIVAYLNKNRISELNNIKDVLEEDVQRKIEAEKVYDKLKEEIKDLEKELRKVGLLNLYNRNIDEDTSALHSISRLISYFNSEKDIDKFYKFIDSEEEPNREYLRYARRDVRDYYSEISEKSRCLLINCLDTCKVIKEFANYPIEDHDICPAVTIYILKGLVEIEDSNYEDKEFSEYEIEGISNYFKNIMNTNYESFLSEFNEIKRSKYDKIKEKNK